MTTARRLAVARADSAAFGATQKDVPDGLHARRRTMTLQLARLEAAIDGIEPGPAQALGTVYLQALLVLRDLLVRATGATAPEPTASSFERRLGDAVLRTYEWALGQIASVRGALKGETCNSPPAKLRALTVFDDLSNECSPANDAPVRELTRTLRLIDYTLYRLIYLRNRLEGALGTPRG